MLLKIALVIKMIGTILPGLQHLITNFWHSKKFNNLT